MLLNCIEKAYVKVHGGQNSPFGIGKYVNSSCGRLNPKTEICVEFVMGYLGSIIGIYVVEKGKILHLPEMEFLTSP